MLPRLCCCWCRYFFDGEEALGYYPQWSLAYAFAAAADSPAEAVGGGDVTLLVPGESLRKHAAVLLLLLLMLGALLHS
jgi:hypothetical protein